MTTMPDDKDKERSNRERRRSRLIREKDVRKSDQRRASHLESKVSAEKLKLDARICRLQAQGYSKAAVAKRLGVTLRRIDLAINVNPP